MEDVFLVDLKEKKKNPDTRTSAYEYLLPYSQDSNMFISFTSLDKLGINPQSDYNTPLGIYAYPLKEFWEKYEVDKHKSVGKVAPFAGERPYVWLIKKKDNVRIVDDMSTYGEVNLKKDLAKLKEYILSHTEEFVVGGWGLNSSTPEMKKESVDEMSDDFIRGASHDVPIMSMWNLTRRWAQLKEGRGTVQWNTILRLLGYAGFVDRLGNGYIHPSEPMQAVFLSSRAFDVVRQFLNKDYMRLKAPGESTWLHKALGKNHILLSDDAVFIADKTGVNPIFKSGTWESGTWDNGLWEGGVWQYGAWEKGKWLKGTWEEGNWYGGEWLGGTWITGVWHRGTWHSGLWVDGYWYQGEWENGRWGDGIWENGHWGDGIWENGYWYQGEWDKGTWLDGKHLGGFWYDGAWKDGTWRDGTWMNGTWEDGLWEDGDWKNGIWKQGTWMGGNWQGGEWLDGVWEAGRWWRGNWYDGEWRGGKWVEGNIEYEGELLPSDVSPPEFYARKLEEKKNHFNSLTLQEKKEYTLSTLTENQQKIINEQLASIDWNQFGLTWEDFAEAVVKGDKNGIS